MSPSNQQRIERDSLGEREIPSDVYYGIQTARAVENFPISGWRPYSALVTATVQIKKAAARVNAALGVLDPKIGEAIERAAEEVLAGQLRDQFVVDPFQAGAGTSHNMNVNEVLANRAIELLGGKKGDYSVVHPNDHVNMGQSTNDVFPTAMRLSALELAGDLIPALDALSNAFQAKADEFKNVVKSGRTHLQDAVPMTVGQEFGGYAAAISSNAARIRAATDELTEIGLGGTAVGTGLNAAPGYRKLVVQELSRLTGLPLKPATNYFEAMQSLSPFVGLSGALKTAATDLIRIANDLRLLASGPNTGLAEIKLPAVQPGSSIMPGKVNPVMAEMTDMVCFQVIGNDLTITMAAQAGQLELNVMMPVIAFNVLLASEILGNSMAVLAERTVTGIEANAEQCAYWVERSAALATALAPQIGYARAAEISKQSVKQNVLIRDLVKREQVLPPAEIDEVLDLRKMTEIGVPGGAHGGISAG